MQTIKELINKIRWDKRETPNFYSLYYFDRIGNKLIKLNFSNIERIEGNDIITIKEGKEIFIPLHRIRRVEKNGRIVWGRSVVCKKS